MIVLDGIEYNVKSAEENANDALAAINTFCNENNIRNRHGELVQIEANYANPLYILLLGVGYLFSMIQKLVYSAGCALSIASSSERQLLNIASIAGVRRRRQTKTTVTCIVYSDLTEGPCSITTSLSATVVTGSGSVVLHPAFDISIPVGSSRSIVMVAEVYGSYNIAENAITSFDENPEHFRSMASLAGSPGQDTESIRSLRARIQRRTTNNTVIDKAAEAIGQLDGVSVCNIFFNKSAAQVQVINNIEVPPRKSLLFVQGFSQEIARTYWSQLTCECAGESASSAVEQVYTTKSGQALPVYIIPPEMTPVYLKVHYNCVIEDALAQTLRDAISTIAATHTIGQVLQSSEVINVLEASYSISPAGVELSLDGVNYSYQVQPGDYQLLVFNNDNIKIEGE